MTNKHLQDDELKIKKKLRENFFTASEGYNAIIALEKELNKKLEPINHGVKQLTCDKYIIPSEREQIRKDAKRLVSKITHEFWEDALETKRSIVNATPTDIIRSVGRKAPFEVSIEEATKLVADYNTRIETRKYLESIGLQPVIWSLGKREIGGYFSSWVNDLTKEDIQAVISGWKEGKDFQEIAKNLNAKSAFHAMNEKKIIAIMRGVVISGIPQGKTEGVEAVVNSVLNQTELSAEEKKKYGLSDLEYKGIKNSVEIAMVRNPLAASLEFFKKNYHELELGDKDVDVGHYLSKIGPEYIKNILKNEDSVALAFKLDGGAGALKRFNLDQSGMPYMDAEGRNKEISTSGRMAALAFMQPWHIEPFRMLMYEHMVPSQNKEVVIDGMRSEHGRELFKKLEGKEKLGLTSMDSFGVFVTKRKLAKHAVDIFRERMEDVQKKGGELLSEYIEGRLISGDSVAAIKNDMHPFIQSEVELEALIRRGKLQRELQRSSIDDG